MSATTCWQACTSDHCVKIETNWNAQVWLLNLRAISLPRTAFIISQRYRLHISTFQHEDTTRVTKPPLYYCDELGNWRLHGTGVPDINCTCFSLATMLTSKIRQKLQKSILNYLRTRMAVINLFQVDLDKPCNYGTVMKKHLCSRCPLFKGQMRNAAAMTPFAGDPD